MSLWVLVVGQQCSVCDDACGGQTDHDGMLVERDATVVQLAAQLVRSFPSSDSHFPRVICGSNSSLVVVHAPSLSLTLCVFLALAMFVWVCAGGTRRIAVGLAGAAGVCRGAV